MPDVCPIGTEIQTVLVPHAQFPTREKARAWIVEHGFRATKADVGKSVTRFRQIDPDHFEPKSFRTIPLGKSGMQAVAESTTPPPPDHAVTRNGDLWKLGDHRMFCGDSSSTEDLDRLLDGAPIHMLNTDPPYNVKVEPRSDRALAAGGGGMPGGGQYEKIRTGTLEHKQLRAKD